MGSTIAQQLGSSRVGHRVEPGAPRVREWGAPGRPGRAQGPHRYNATTVESILLGTLYCNSQIEKWYCYRPEHSNSRRIVQQYRSTTVH